MQDILVLGAGKIGALISGLLAESRSYRVQLADAREGGADEVAAAHGLDNIVPVRLDAADADALKAYVQRHRPVAVVSGLPYFCNVAVAEVARNEGLHYFDLTEDVAVTARVREIANDAD
jgi:saccharopine dehydrogenase-like NADP-dependent oxidoreductase